MKNTASDAEQALLPGVKPVVELLQSEPGRVDCVFLRRGLRSKESGMILDMCRKTGIRFSLLDAPLLDKMCAAQHQGVLARLTSTSLVPWEELLAGAPDAPLPCILALDQVQDPGNVGTLARTCYALGGAGLLVPKHNSAYLGGAARRSAAGALERLPVASVTNLGHALDSAEEAGFALVGTGMHGTSLNAFTDPLPTPLVLVLGNEDKGLRPAIAKRCTHMVHIPMLRDFDSLNVAQAGAVLMGLFARQHITFPK